MHRTIAGIVRDRMAQSGIDNYSFSDGALCIGSTCYKVEACGCGEEDCDGVRLLPITRPLPMPYAGQTRIDFPNSAA